MKEAMELAEYMAKSEFVPAIYQGRPGDIIVAMQCGAELGLKPFQALHGIAVINGRATVWGDAATALVEASGLMTSFREYFAHSSDTETALSTAEVNRLIDSGDDELVAICEVGKKGFEGTHKAMFSIADAKRAKLWGNTKKSPWMQYPARMMMWRARGFAFRDRFPEALKGMVFAEEAQDYTHVNVDTKKLASDLVEPKPIDVAYEIAEPIELNVELDPAVREGLESGIAKFDGRFGAGKSLEGATKFFGAESLSDLSGRHAELFLSCLNHGFKDHIEVSKSMYDTDLFSDLDDEKIGMVISCVKIQNEGSDGD
jgi:hypothetical protein